MGLSERVLVVPSAKFDALGRFFHDAVVGSVGLCQILEPDDVIVDEPGQDLGFEAELDGGGMLTVET